MDFPGEKLLTRMWETAEKGGAGLLRPWQMRRVAKALSEVRRDEVLMLAQAEQEAAAIRSGEMHFDPSKHILRLTYRNEFNTDEFDASVPPLVATIASAEMADRLRREVNVAKALHHAEASLEGDSSEPPKERPDEDWFFRWRDNASQVSTDELQYLWGRVLAGEVKAPGAFSLRTLDVLKNLSKQEAELINLASQFTIKGVIYKADAHLAEKGLTFNELLKLQAIGLVSGVGGALTTRLAMKNPALPIRFDAIGSSIICLGATLERMAVLPCYPLTPIGGEIFQLCQREIDDEYVRLIAKDLKNQGFQVFLVIEANGASEMEEIQ